MNKYKKQLLTLKQKRQYLIIMILFFVGVIFWIAGSLIVVVDQYEIDDEMLKMARPVTAKIDMKVFEELKIKPQYSEEDLEHFPIYVDYQENKEYRSNTNSLIIQGDEESEGATPEGDNTNPEDDLNETTERITNITDTVTVEEATVSIETTTIE